MVDFATLILDADSRGLKTGEQALNSIASTAERTENRVNKANDNVSKGMQQVGKQSIFAGQQSRMMAMQLSQVAQQASATGNWVQALAIQLPDLALGFGTIGIAAGVVAGALLPIIANMVMSGDEADRLKDAMDSLEEATKAYAEATENASQSAADLITQFGSQAEEAGRVYEMLRKIKELEFQETLMEAQSAISDALTGLQESMDQFDMASMLPDFARDESIGLIRTQVQYLNNEFGLTLVQATRINDALDALAAANGPEQVADAAQNLGDQLSKAVEEGAKLSPELRAVQKDAYEAALSAAQFARLTADAIAPANGLAVAVGSVADQYARAAQFAAALTGRFPSQGAYDGVERSADGAIQGSGTILPDVGPTPTGRGTPELSGFPWEKIGGGGSRKRGGGGKSEAENYDSIVEAANRRIETLKAEREAIGMTEEAAAKLRNETDLFNDAQQKGIKLTDEQKAGLTTLAETMSKLEEETRLANEQQKFFEGISDDLKNGILDVILEGENLDDVFKGLAKSIARAALEAALFGSGPMAGGGGAGGGLLGSLFGGFTKLFSFDGGGSTGSGSRSGGVDGKGGFPAILHPNETVVDHTKGGSGGSQVQVSVVSRFDGNGNFETAVEGISQKTVQSAAPGIVSAANQQVVPTMAKYQANKAGGDWR